MPKPRKAEPKNKKESGQDARAPNFSTTIAVRVIPRASRNKIEVQADHSYKIHLTSPPVDGAANRQLIQLLSKTFSVPARQIEIVSGINSRNKIICVYSPQRHKEFL